MHISYDVIVVGGGHAGCEAALASARMGMQTALLSMNLDTIAQMSCNPAIGGLAKGQLVREVDALGGEMGKVIDETAIQFRLLNASKGHAVRSPRAQADKKKYQFTMKKRLEEQYNLSLRQDSVEEIVVENRERLDLIGKSGTKYRSKAVIITTGTFLNGLIHIGNSQVHGGRSSEPSSDKLSAGLKDLGFELARLKTGTSPRLNGRKINYDILQEQEGDKQPTAFSFSTKNIQQPQVNCFITYTNKLTHEIIRSNLDRSPLYTGQIKAIGPRYCPSIEDKITRFPHKEQHQIFIEPEGLHTSEVYCNGISTSAPFDVQEAMVHSIKGLEETNITRYGYAIEYDYVPPTQIKPSLEAKNVENVFLAGQINGTSGYEEAAAQGIMAGINAVLKIRGSKPFVLDRSEAYIGVLIDDLVTKGTREPYRMFTSRAEYRLVLRHDNADRRLMKYGYKHGLISKKQWDELSVKEKIISETNKYLEYKKHGADSLIKLLRRPDMNFKTLLELDKELMNKNIPSSAQEQIEIEAKYKGYISRQNQQIEKFKRMENLMLPAQFHYDNIPGLRKEAQQKLDNLRPVSLGQASRISGVSPADISILMVYLLSKGKPDTRTVSGS
ncbi:tRNA uridine 5-carboxymethylaminomethyl modification enzyme MnmG [Candidatus Scalindua japonica]|uniref:tRNA uridine 5-carboxymethylaminomethyl modification enzyme MnmG n=1 Tax=Candidatus Scalindua japonica TaxID=1284222 RepID=A0A286TUF8_9BACT|nr:tRNA uridine-5-carboxymethylaminomethyl(34) synthesis enzyme MnmG [Candidatus Scalindua japonica]GAX59494.1 tRNA uridine 5-carboxymethylaminomethyl modification enzyme MnmG [Candidatus Scalindua japonica]